jgi:predicted nucleotidyltransferase
MSSRFTKVPSLGPLLDRQISELKRFLPHLKEVKGILLSGSCARGEATYRSDIDLLIILENGPLNYSRVQQIRDNIEQGLIAQSKADLLDAPLPVQITVVLDSVFSTSEPAMRDALKSALILVNPEGTLKGKVA